MSIFPNIINSIQSPLTPSSPYNDYLKTPSNSCYLYDAIFFGRRSECRSDSQGPFLECLTSLILRLKASAIPLPAFIHHSIKQQIRLLGNTMKEIRIHTGEHGAHGPHSSIIAVIPTFGLVSKDPTVSRDLYLTVATKQGWPSPSRVEFETLYAQLGEFESSQL
jgi:hypothetical protein